MKRTKPTEVMYVIHDVTKYEKKRRLSNDIMSRDDVVFKNYSTQGFKSENLNRNQ
jgi:hypothetical protein